MMNYGQEFWKTAAQGQKTNKGKTSVRITFPAGEGFKIFNMAEVSSEAGTTVTFTLPFPMGEAGLGKMIESLRQTGATVEIINK